MVGRRAVGSRFGLETSDKLQSFCLRVKQGLFHSHPVWIFHESERAMGQGQGWSCSMLSQSLDNAGHGPYRFAWRV